MRMILILSIALSIFTPMVAHAQYLELRPYEGADSVFTEPAGAGIREMVVVFNSVALGMSGVRFGIGQSGTNWQVVSVTSPYATLGYYGDLSVSFGSCISGSHVVATVTFVAPGNSPCGTVYTQAPSGYACATGWRCDYSETCVSDVPLWINGAALTYPGVEEYSCGCPPIATAPSTWGKVKSLYRY